MSILTSGYPTNSPENISNLEKRESSRFPSDETVVFENYMSGNFNVGQMVNYSKGGMCFQAGAKLNVGGEIYIGTDKLGSHSGPGIFRTRVVWFKEHPDKQVYTFGLKFF